MALIRVSPGQFMLKKQGPTAGLHDDIPTQFVMLHGDVGQAIILDESIRNRSGPAMQDFRGTHFHFTSNNQRANELKLEELTDHTYVKM